MLIETVHIPTPTPTLLTPDLENWSSVFFINDSYSTLLTPITVSVGALPAASK
jgi:hypothetical protein